MSLRDRRLKNDLEGMLQLNEWSSMIEIYPTMSGEIANDYTVIFHCSGIIDRNGTSGTDHKVQLYLSADYPRVPPVAKVLTPIFHPNISTPLQNTHHINTLMARLDREPDRRKREQYLRTLREDKDLQVASICLDILQMNWAPSLPLYIVCIEIGEMIQYKRINPDHPLNQEAAEWAKRNRHLFPVDKRILLDKRPASSTAQAVSESITIDLTMKD